jgi:hypothetical protein
VDRRRDATGGGCEIKLIMDDYFALARDEQRGFCELAAAQIKLDAPSIEKDFWVKRSRCRRPGPI